MPKIRVDVVSGFLGAGKTTLIRKLLAGLGNEKVVIIENEFGEVGIDGALLKSTGIEVREINSGCICCTVSGDFEKAILDVLKKFDPSRIIIEPSGVGKLSEVLKVLNSPSIIPLVQQNMTIAVVDVTKYDMYLRNFGEFFGDQVSHATTIILSRTQKISAEKTALVCGKIRELNPQATIITTPWEQLEATTIIAAAETRREPLLCSCGHDLDLDHDHHHSHNHHGDDCGCAIEHEEHCEHDHNLAHAHAHTHDTFEAWHMETPRAYSEDEIKAVLARLEDSAEFGLVLRGKGILENASGGWMQFHYVPGETVVSGVASDITGRLCVIGQHLNTHNLSKAFGVV